ncbi:site-specific recombinase [Variovorax sp. HJSM1_2]|uniref:site-specific recombinase n=1 Tax=Variovorax sp. HJSM1_2 TaxID=3366263 RepID=UPI003BCDB534
MTQGQNPLSTFFSALDAHASLTQRNLWLIQVVAWIRGPKAEPELATQRLQLFINTVSADAALAQRLQDWWRALLESVDATTLLADFGFAPRSAFITEVGERLRRKLLPSTPDTIDASELFSLVFNHADDTRWLSAVTDEQATALASLLTGSTGHLSLAGRNTVLDAIAYCTTQMQAAGFSSELRLRMHAKTLESRPFHMLDLDVQALRESLERPPEDEAGLPSVTQRFRARLDACRHAAASVYTHLEENGISVGMVFRLRQMRERVLRIRELLELLQPASAGPVTLRFVARMALLGRDRSSLRALVAANSTLLAAKVTERSAETGVHYITRDSAEYRSMLRKAAGGGALTGLTTLLKFLMAGLALSAFWNGFWLAMMYAGSFVLIQLLHCTLATKQPAMTAPALAAKLKTLSTPGAVSAFVDEVTYLVKSQVAAVLGNVVAVFPVVLAISAAWQYFFGHALIDTTTAHHVFDTLDVRGGALLFAAFTGVLLFSASIIAGWAENWFVLHRLDSALRYNPSITRWLGHTRADRWSTFLRANISGFASNISLGLMLGLVPAFATFFGLPLDVRHVTLSTGQLAAAVAAMGWDVLDNPQLWWCLLAIPFIGLLNLLVSFFLAFRLALRAHSVGRADRLRIRSAIWARLRREPLSFLLPTKQR